MPKTPKPDTDLPLFQYWQRQPRRPVPPVIFLPGATTAEGEPRPALVIPGRRFPVAFPSLAAALAAQRRFGGAA